MQFGERERATVAPGEEFAVEDAVGGERERGAGEVGELRGDAVEIARVEFDAVGGFVELAADAVVFLFEPDGRRQTRENRGRGGLGAGQHELDRLKRAKLNRGERAGEGGAGDGGEVAAEHMGFADEFDGLGGSGGEGVFDKAVFQADAEVTEEEFDQVFRFYGMEGGEAGLEQLELRGGRAGGGEGDEKIAEVDQGERRGGCAILEGGRGGVTGVGEVAIGSAVVSLGEAGDSEEGAFDEGVAEIEGEGRGLRERTAGEVEGGRRGGGMGICGLPIADWGGSRKGGEVVAEEGGFFEPRGLGGEAVGEEGEGAEGIGGGGVEGGRSGR